MLDGAHGKTSTERPLQCDATKQLMRAIIKIENKKKDSYS